MLNALATFADAIAIPDFQFPDFYDDNLHTPITKINSELEQFKNFIRFGHLNAVSVPKHREEIYRVIRETLLDIFAVCETNIKPGTPSHLYQMPGYKLIRADRTHSAKGGLGVYCKSEYNPKKIAIKYEKLQPELLFIELEINRNKVAVGVIYKSPAASYGVYAEIQEIIAFITTKYKHVIIMGDFNIDLLKNDRPSNFFRNTILKPFSLHQVINEPTRITENTATSIDHIFVTESENVKHSGVADFPGISDHCMIYMAYSLKRPKFKPVKIVRRDFKHFNENDYIADMEIAPWGNIHTLGEDNNEISIDDKVTVLENIFRENIDKHAPLKEITIKKPIKSFWMTDEILHLMDTRDKYKNMFNRYKDQFFHDRYKELRNKVNHKIRRVKMAEFNKTINEKVKDSKQFHKALKKHNVVSASKPDNTSCGFSPNKLNDTFSANNNNPVNFEKITNTINNINRQEKKGGCFRFQDVSERDVIEVVKSLKSNAVGVDEISSYFVKLSIVQSAAAIADIVNTSFRYNTFPERWKKAIIIAIPKITTPIEPTDYRPISLLSVLSKILEKLVAKQMIQYLNLHNLFDEKQSAYRKGHSTGTALLEISDHIFNALDSNQIAILTLLDYTKAFDCANHDIMIAKLKAMGFSNSALIWVKSYLSGRSQRVKTQEGFSDWVNLVNGVPQGSILGPLLFTVLLCDINNSIKHCKVHLYADDTQIYICGRLTDIVNMVEKLNSDLERIHQFSDANNLLLNIKKCKFIILGSAKNLVSLNNLNIPPIVLGNKSLKREVDVYDLGMLLDENLTWEKHIDYVISKAYGKLKTAYLAKNFLSKKSKIAVVEYYILSQLSYCNFLMQNLSHKLILKIQKLQNACTRFIFGLRKYDHISAHFNQLMSLNMQNRRILNSASLMHKIVNNKAPTYLCSKIRYRNSIHNHNTRGNCKIQISNYRNLYGKNRFFRIVAQKYNNFMDIEGINQDLSIGTFKKRLKQHLLSSQ